MERLLDGKCSLTGLPFHFGANNTKGIAHPFSASVDRIDSGGDYVQSNCRLVLMMINMALNAWGETAFAQIAEAYMLNQALK